MAETNQSVAKTPGPLQWIVWSALGLTIVAILLAFLRSPSRVARSSAAFPVLFPAPEFTLTNQQGQPVTLSSLKGHVWIADIVFTRCGGPCPAMTRKMADLQSALPSDAKVKLVTFTADPEFDTPSVLSNYARGLGADPNRWLFLTGTKQQIVAAAVDGLKFIAREKEPAQRENDADLFIHSTLFLLVDQRGQVRGIFESENYEAPGKPVSGDANVKPQLLEAISRLLREK